MATIETAKRRAHRETVRAEDIAAVARFLCELLGPSLVRYLSNVGADRSVRRWASGERVPREQYEQRLRGAYQVAKLMLGTDTSGVVRAWFVGMNPDLDDASPATVIRRGRIEAAYDAAANYVEAA